MILDSVINKTLEKDYSSEQKEGLKRSIAKTISWRLVGTLELAFSIGLVELVTKMGLYFFHERAWNKIKWG